ncbi:hypothetical protein ACI79G_08030 [Geodermatophilus sp. SYSU D00779]
MLVEVLPEVVQAAAAPLAGVDEIRHLRRRRRLGGATPAADGPTRVPITTVDGEESAR